MRNEWVTSRPKSAQAFHLPSTHSMQSTVRPKRLRTRTGARLRNAWAMAARTLARKVGFMMEVAVSISLSLRLD